MKEGEFKAGSRLLNIFRACEYFVLRPSSKKEARTN
jgi:hypothetical protein